jgi:two-component system LytT family response regulator
MDKIRTLIVDDIKMDIDLLREVLRKDCPNVEVVGAAQTLAEAERLIFDLKPQLVFLDISMDNEGATSFQLLDKIGEANLFFEIIFYTAHGNKANQLRAIQFSDLDFIHKPVDPETVVIAVEKASKRLAGGIYRQQLELFLELLQQADRSNTRIVIERVGGQRSIITVGDIVMMKADGPVTEFTLVKGDTFIASKHLGYYESLLNDYYFYRIHHNLFVNLSYATSLNNRDKSVALSTGQTVVASKHKWSDFNQFIKENKQKLPQLSGVGVFAMLKRILGS